MRANLHATSHEGEPYTNTSSQPETTHWVMPPLRVIFNQCIERAENTFLLTRPSLLPAFHEIRGLTPHNFQ